MKPTDQPDRRSFLHATTVAITGTLAGANSSTAARPDALQAIDAHTHFYDPTRPGGVPWPGKDDRLLYRRVLPDEFARLAGKHGVTATIVVEASPLVEDNQWLLDLAKRNKTIVGVVGRLDPLLPTFPRLLERFGKAPLFRGIRIDHATLVKGLGQKSFLAHLRRLAEADRQLDVNGGPDMPADVARLARVVPELRVVINHAGNLTIDGKAPPAAWLKGMRAAAQGRQVFCKVSALVEGTRKTKGDAPKDPAFYRPVLDALWKTFGEERLIYGSNWPVSDHSDSYATVHGIVAAWIADHGERARRKFFRGNALRAYKPPAARISEMK
jgi:predicted TIM-barrel fold metal-dependent hydrolase